MAFGHTNDGAGRLRALLMVMCTLNVSMPRGESSSSTSSRASASSSARIGSGCRSATSSPTDAA
eukprot:4841914-Prymnesium_polylepis.1